LFPTRDGIRIFPIVSNPVQTYTAPDNPHEKINDDGSRTVRTITKMKLCLNRRLLIFLLIILFGLPNGARAQTFRFGGLVSSQTYGEFYQGRYTLVPQPPISSPNSTDTVSFGPMAQVRLSHHLSVEVDALYRRSFYSRHDSYSIFQNAGYFSGASDREAHSWEAPALLEWHGFEGAKNLFVGGGVSFRSVSGTIHDVASFKPNCFTLNCHTTTNSDDYQASISDLPHHRTYGGVIASGIDIQKGVFHLYPQIRYIRWSTSLERLERGSNAVQILMGISVGQRSRH